MSIMALRSEIETNLGSTSVTQNPDELAGVSSDHYPPPQTDDTPDYANAREVFPVRFEKDFMDFTPQNPDLEEAVAPKSSSAQVSAEPLKSVTGLEDLSAEDLESPALPNAEKDKNPTTTMLSASGPPTSSKAI